MILIYFDFGSTSRKWKLIGNLKTYPIIVAFSSFLNQIIVINLDFEYNKNHYTYSLLDI